MFTGSMGRISVFSSYAREDEAIREKLETWLRPLREERIIDDWYDNRIMPGQHWNAEIGAALDRARLMLFIVTPDLMASSYVAEVEIPKAIERERIGQCQVVPIMARKVDWFGSPLAQFQALPGDGKWIDDYADQGQAFTKATAGVREVCKRIVDWANPYKRAQVGDWAHSEQTMIMDDGRQITAEGTEELVAMTDLEATLLMEVSMAGMVQQKTVKIDLTQPLEDRMGDLLRQSGVDIPANVEISVGPARYSDEVLSIGGHNYETMRAERTLTLAQRGQKFQGEVATWRCIDVPLYGAVKAEGSLPGFRQYQVLIDYGFGDAASRKPRFQAGQGMPGVDFGAMTAIAMTPGRWMIQMNAFGVESTFDTMLYPNGMMQGQQQGMGLSVQLQGQWSFDAASQTLTFHIVTFMMGAPVGQETVVMQFSGSNAGMLYARDAMGRQFQLHRLG